MPPSAPRPGAPPGYPVLLGLLVLAAAAPLLAPFVPEGPARLLSPAAAAVAASVILPAWALLVWPVLARDRSASAVGVGGLYLLAGGLPFVLGLALSAGVERERALAAAAVSGAGIAVAGAFLAGPGRRGRGDRMFVAGAVVVAGALPFVNYALNEFGGTAWSGFYPLSPVLVLRRLLLELPGADPVPCLVLCAAAVAAFLVSRTLAGGVAAALVAAAGLAGAAPEVELPAGGPCVPGRLVPLRVRAEGEVEVRTPDGGRLRSVAGGGFAEFLVPASPGGGPVVVRAGGTEWNLEVPAVPVPDGHALLLALGPVPDALPAAAAAERILVALAAGDLADPAGVALLAADAVYDPEGRLSEEEAGALGSAGVPVLRSTSPGDLRRIRAESGLLRRPWEERGRELMENDLGRVFAPPAPAPSRPATALLVLALYAVAASIIARQPFRRRTAGVLLLAVAGAGVAGLLAHLCPPRPDVRVEEFSVREGAREVRLIRLSARREATARLEGLPNALVLGGGRWQFDRTTGVAEVGLRRGETRLLVSQRLGPARAASGPFDLVVSGGALAGPGEDPRAPDVFLRERYRTPGGAPDVRGHRIRKLLRLSDPPPGTFDVLLPADRAEVTIVRRP